MQRGFWFRPFILHGSLRQPWLEQDGPVFAAIEADEDRINHEAKRRFWKQPIMHTNVTASVAALTPLFEDFGARQSVSQSCQEQWCLLLPQPAIISTDTCAPASGKLHIS